MHAKFKNKFHQSLYLIFLFTLLAFFIYKFGDSPSKEPFLFILFTTSISLFFLYMFCVAAIRKIVRCTSSIWVRDNIPGNIDRANNLAMNVLKFIFWSNWWIAIIAFILVNPLAISLKQSLEFFIVLIFFLLIDFIARQVSLNWLWKNNTQYAWKFDTKEQFMSISRHLFLSPLILFILFNNNFEIYSVNSSFLENKDGWLWYIFSFVGFITLVAPLFKLLFSFVDPESIIENLTEETYDEHY
jgi:hypothetical protein